MRFTALLFLPFVSLTGCVPYRFTTPSAEGRVVDRETGHPVKGATVFWASWPDGKAESAEDGTYSLPPEEKSRWIVAVGTHLPSKATGPLRVEALGYRSELIKPPVGTQEILLQKK